MTRAEAVARLVAAGVPGAARDVALLERAAPDGTAFAEMVRRRAAREPLSHLLGRRAFWKHDFIVTPDVLDPRPETETLVEAALAQPFTQVLDLGTGSGCILLSLLAERPAARGLGTDLSAAALTVAARNATQLDVADRVTWQRANWMDGVDGTFDLIVSNPPYIAADEMAALTPEVLREPHMALSPGGDGLDAYRTIARDAPGHLSPDGHLMVEIGHRQAVPVLELMRAAGLANLRVLQDLDGRDRVISAQKCSR